MIATPAGRYPAGEDLLDSFVPARLMLELANELLDELHRLPAIEDSGKVVAAQHERDHRQDLLPLQPLHGAEGDTEGGLRTPIQSQREAPELPDVVSVLGRFQGIGLLRKVEEHLTQAVAVGVNDCQPLAAEVF